MFIIIQLLALFAIIYASPNKKEVQNIGYVKKYDKLESQHLYNVFRKMYGSSLESGKVNSTGCHCIGYNCGCCLYIKIKEIKLHDTVCANFSYLPAPEYGISFTLSIDKKTIIKETISARNPPPICIDIPKLKQLASVCLEFKDLKVSDKSFSGCVYLDARLLKLRIETIKLGCFVIPPEIQIKRARVTVL